MATKKKKKVVVNTSSTVYTGNVSVTVTRNGKVCSTYKTSNNGKWPLFVFLAFCSSGQYSEADDYRPKYIDMFSLGEEGTELVDPFNVSTSWQQRLVTPIMLDTTPGINWESVTDRESDKVEGSTSTLKFTIPYSQITNKSDINFLCLRCESKKSEQKTVSAYIIVKEKDDNDNDVLGSLLPEEFKKDDYIINVEWKLNFNNETYTEN